MIVVVCKRRLLEKMETQLSSQIDSSIQIYLQEFDKKEIFK
jgi:hypothetical protein